MVERRILPDERPAVTRKFSVDGFEGYVTIGLYEDGTPGEMFLRMSKVGSTLSGFNDSFARAVSLLLQSGWSVDELSKKFIGFRFEPMGYTGDPEIEDAGSIIDYVFRWMKLRWGTEQAGDR